jgi:hypothetical protein
MNEKLTMCGCEECEEKMGKLLEWVDSVANRYPLPKTICKYAREIPVVHN